MAKFEELSPDEFKKSPFKIIGKAWMLVTAKKDNDVNTMTAGWGGLGVMWGKNVAFVVIRPQRYTREFVDSSETFSLSFFDVKYKKQLGYLGSVSGRDEDKITKSGFTVLEHEDTPYFKEAKTVLLCKKLYKQEMKSECFINQELDEKWYPDKDYHEMYIAEIEKIMIKK